MNITGTIVCILIAIVMLLFAIFSIKEAIIAKKELKEFEKKADEAERKAEEDKQTLVNHNEKSNEIKEEKEKAQKEINDAKTKEELIAVANSIADNNNNKLRKQKEGGE